MTEPFYYGVVGPKPRGCMLRSLRQFLSPPLPWRQLGCRLGIAKIKDEAELVWRVLVYLLLFVRARVVLGILLRHKVAVRIRLHNRKRGQQLLVDSPRRCTCCCAARQQAMRTRQCALVMTSISELQTHAMRADASSSSPHLHQSS